MCRVSRVRCHMSGVICQALCVRCHLSGVRCQVSGVRYHVSGVRCHMSHFFVTQNRGASWWRVCYQQGLPHLVFSHCDPFCIVLEISTRGSDMHHAHVYPFSFLTFLPSFIYNVLQKQLLKVFAFKLELSLFL